MARKTNGSPTPRSKKTMESAPVQPAPTLAAPEVIKPEFARPEVREKMQAAGVVAGKTSVNVPQNLDEEIRRRAYELYQQRNGKAGDPNRDWFIAEREVRARHATAGHSA